jgi:tRNA threonylcarbamoyladenosine biosynthesis protein TsaB
VKILALDTATEACSAAVVSGDTVFSRFETLGRGHAERLLPMVDELLHESGLALGDLDFIAVGRGPGAFTGVRIAISIAQGLSLGTGRPIVPVSDLWALGAGALARTPADCALACLDARMGEVYWGLVRALAEGESELVAEGLAAPADVPEPPAGARCVGAGHGWSAYPALGARLGGGLLDVHAGLLPDAATIAQLALQEWRAGRRCSAAEVEPVYLRNEVATRSTRAPGA